MWKKMIALPLFLVASGVTLAQRDLDTAAFDRSVRAQDDLFQHVNGSWLQNTRIPADKSNYGSFIKLDDLSRQRIRKLVEVFAEQKNEAGSDGQKVGDYFSSFMDEEAIERAGISPLRDVLRDIDLINSKGDLFGFFGQLQVIGVSVPAVFYVSQDAKDSTRYLCHLTQGGITLPDRDYYLMADDKQKDARDALVTYIESIFRICKFENGATAAREILDLETRLAEAQIERVVLRDAEKRYNLYRVDRLQKTTDQLNWEKFLAEAIDQEVTEINVNTPAFFTGLNSLFAEIELSVWKKYLKFRVINSFAPVLQAELVQAHFDLHSKAVAGIKQQLPRWKRAVNAISGAGAGDFGALGDVVGRLYVAEHFPPEAKAEMDILVKNLLTAFGNSIDDLAWMTDETKKRAQQKLARINAKIGYTSKWREYDALNVVPGDLFANTVNSNRLEFRRMTERLGKPVDRERWGMTPQTVNAYYNPTLNEIVFPAAILQSPFFSKDAEPALNYGGIGAVIGHEISHAFDDQGSKYDGDGNLNNWWTEEDKVAFKALTERLIAQYAEYEPLEGNRVNGRLTLGENIADLSGLSIAHRAYQLSLDGQTPPKVAGWTGDQLFFVGWSRVWRRKYRDAEMVRRLLTDPHSPSQYRANGPVANIDAFYQAFDVKKGDLLYKPKEERIKIW